MIMHRIDFDIQIKAPKEKVWKVLLEDETYRKWTSAFMEGSYYQGKWERGNKMYFLSPDGNGMVSMIKEYKPNELVVIEHLGEIKNGIEDLTSDAVQQWKGALEIYRISEVNGVSTLIVEQDIGEDYVDEFREVWPEALDKVKELAEEE